MDKNIIDSYFKKIMDAKVHPFDEKQWIELENRMKQHSLRNVRKNYYWKAVPIASSVAALLLVGLFFYFSDQKKKRIKIKENQITSISLDNFKDSTDNTDFKKSKGRLPLAESPTFASGHSELQYEKNQNKNIRMLLGSNPANIVKSYTYPAKKLNLEGLRLDLESHSIQANLSLNNRLFPNRSTLKEEEMIGIDSKEDNGITLFPSGTLSILAGPDRTRVLGSRENSFSSNFAVLYSQPIGNRISLSTGIAYSKKNYSSDYNLYKPLNPIPAYYKPTNVDASCDVLSIPFSVNMMVAKIKDSELSVSLGTSSLFMLKEDYIISYAELEDRKYSVIKENKHYFSTLDFSVSFHRKVSRQLKIGIKPYIQVPLKGVGYGRTPLESKGLALSIDFDLK